MKKIAICIPTFNRPKVVFDTCSKIINIVDRDLADIYIYDSSTDDETKKVFDEIEQNNFFYIKKAPSVHSSKKVFDIYQDKYIQRHYEYLWILADYLFFNKVVISEVFNKLNEKWDMLMLDFYDPEKMGSCQCFSPNKIFYEYAWSMTQYGIMIVNCSSVLKRADWIYLQKKYLIDQHKNFSHVMMYFEIMLQIDRLRFYHFSIARNNICISKNRSDVSEYLNDYLNIWGYCWYKSIKALPRYYRHKAYVIKTACRYTKNLGEANIARLKCRGVLSIKSFQKYLLIWPLVSTVPIILVYIIIFLPNDKVMDIVKYGSTKAWMLHSFCLIRFRRFCRKYKKLYLYGAGIKAERLADLMMDESILFDGFVVTDIKDNKDILKGHAVIELTKLKKEDDIGIIIALNEQNKKEVLPLLAEMGYKNIFKLDLV